MQSLPKVLIPLQIHADDVIDSAVQETTAAMAIESSPAACIQETVEPCCDARAAGGSGDQVEGEAVATEAPATEDDRETWPTSPLRPDLLDTAEPPTTAATITTHASESSVDVDGMVDMTITDGTAVTVDSSAADDCITQPDAHGTQTEREWEGQVQGEEEGEGEGEKTRVDEEKGADRQEEEEQEEKQQEIEEKQMSEPVIQRKERNQQLLLMHIHQLRQLQRVQQIQQRKHQYIPHRQHRTQQQQTHRTQQRQKQQQQLQQLLLLLRKQDTDPIRRHVVVPDDGASARLSTLTIERCLSDTNYSTTAMESIASSTQSQCTLHANAVREKSPNCCSSGEKKDHPVYNV